MQAGTLPNILLEEGDGDEYINNNNNNDSDSKNNFDNNNNRRSVTKLKNLFKGLLQLVSCGSGRGVCVSVKYSRVKPEECQ